MIKKGLVVVLFMLVTAVSAHAFDDVACWDNCHKTRDACLAAVNFPNDIENQDARDVCNATHTTCEQECSKSLDEAREKANAPEEPKQPEDAPQ